MEMVLKSNELNLIYCFFQTGIVVNGYVVGKKPEEGKHMRTYFGKISIMTIDREVSVTVMPSKIKVNDKALTWRNSTTYTVSGVSVNVAARKNVTVSFFNDVTFVVARHKVRKHHPVKVDYLGFYISNGNGLSKKVHGLIGEDALILSLVLRTDNGALLGFGNHVDVINDLSKYKTSII